MEYYELEPIDLQTMGADLRRDISADLGRLPDYAAIDPQILADLRILAREGIVRDPIKYLLFLLAGQGGVGNAKSYVDTVVLGSVDHFDWLANFYEP